MKLRFVRHYDPVNKTFWYNTERRFLLWWEPVGNSGNADHDKAKDTFYQLRDLGDASVRKTVLIGQGIRK